MQNGSEMTPNVLGNTHFSQTKTWKRFRKVKFSWMCYNMYTVIRNWFKGILRTWSFYINTQMWWVIPLRHKHTRCSPSTLGWLDNIFSQLVHIVLLVSEWVVIFYQRVILTQQLEISGFHLYAAGIFFMSHKSSQVLATTLIKSFLEKLE